jgi:hypothetical protein
MNYNLIITKEKIMAQTTLTLADINKALTDMGLPTYNDVAFSLCDVLDGTSDDEVIHDSGLSADDAAKVVSTRSAVKPMWLDHLNSKG